MVACSSDCKEIEGDIGGNLDYSSKVKAAVDFYGPVDIIDNIIVSAESAIKEKDVADTEIDNITNAGEHHIECEILGYTREYQTIQKLYQLIKKGDVNDSDWKFVELAKKCSVKNYIDANCPPILILHGGEDPIVSISQSENFYKELVNAGVDATFITYSKGGHGPSLGRDVDDFAYAFITSRLERKQSCYMQELQ